MNNRERFSDAELDHIVGQGMIYMCACPAQVADALRKLRELLRYQSACLAKPENDRRVHETIAGFSIAAHAALEDCLEEVIQLEHWDRETLEMPSDLRERLVQEMLRDDNLSP
ncbi:MAG: hypothetical protein U5L73_06945 [Rhodoferax sp.]|nr:hypothetical protein [Rhodoferax sp.]